MVHLGLRVLATVAVLAILVAPVDPAVATQEPPSVDVVRLPFPQEDGSLTPYTFELGYPLVTLIYDTLLWRDAEGVARPWLARSVDTSRDNRTVTIELDSGAAWQDGVALTSADVAFTFRFVAAHPHPRFTPQVAQVAAVETPDPSTVVIRLRQPVAGFADLPLADLPILPAHLWEDLPAGRTTPDGLPVGSGPYRLVEHVPGERYRFEANEDYFRGPPLVASIEVPIIRTVAATVQALDEREVDMIPVSLPIDELEQLDQIGLATIDGPFYLGTVLLFNLRQAPFDQPEVRRAVAQALDLDRLSGLVATVVPANRGYLHPDSPWASTEVLHRFDEPAAARRLADLDVGPLEILAPDNDPIKIEAARQVALAMVRAGVEAEARQVSRPELARRLGEDGSTPTFRVAIGSTPPLASHDPDLLARLFGSDPDVARLNVTGYANERFDELAQKVTTTIDPVERQRAVDAELALLATDLPAVPLFFAKGSYAYRPAIYDGWVYVKGSGILDKRSFLPGDRPTTGETDEATGRAGRAGSATDADRLPLGRVALVLVATAGLLFLVAFAHGRR